MKNYNKLTIIQGMKKKLKIYLKRYKIKQRSIHLAVLFRLWMQLVAQSIVGWARVLIFANFPRFIKELMPNSRKSCGPAYPSCLTGRKKSSRQSSSIVIQSVSAFMKRRLSFAGRITSVGRRLLWWSKGVQSTPGQRLEVWKTATADPQRGLDSTVDGSGQVKTGWVKILEIYFCLLKNLCAYAYSDSNLSMWTHPCNVQFTMLYFIVHYAYFSCISCLQDFTLLNVTLTTWRILILYFLNSTFGVIMSWSGRVILLLVIGGSSRVGSQIWRVGSGQRKWTRGHPLVERGKLSQWSWTFCTNEF